MFRKMVVIKLLILKCFDNVEFKCHSYLTEKRCVNNPYLVGLTSTQTIMSYCI